MDTGICRHDGGVSIHEAIVWVSGIRRHRSHRALPHEFAKSPRRGAGVRRECVHRIPARHKIDGGVYSTIPAGFPGIRRGDLANLLDAAGSSGLIAIKMHHRDTEFIIGPTSWSGTMVMGPLWLCGSVALWLCGQPCGIASGRLFRRWESLSRCYDLLPALA
jgi:hypothetical protein